MLSDPALVFKREGGKACGLVGVHRRDGARLERARRRRGITYDSSKHERVVQRGLHRHHRQRHREERVEHRFSL